MIEEIFLIKKAQNMKKISVGCAANSTHRITVPQK